MQKNPAIRHNSYLLVSDRSRSAAAFAHRLSAVAGTPDVHLTRPTLLPSIAGPISPAQIVFLVPGAEGSVLAAMRTLANARDAGRILAVGPPDDPHSAIRAIQAGAAACFSRDQIDALSRELATGGRPAVPAEVRAAESDPFASVVTRDAAMRLLLARASVVARSTEPILITGEPGVGKRLIATSIHAAGLRTGPFVVANLAGLPEPRCSGALFGDQSARPPAPEAGLARAALVDPSADRTREPAGLVERAAGGTLYVSEIVDLTPVAQAGLLAHLERADRRGSAGAPGSIAPGRAMGSDADGPPDTRIIVASRDDLPARVRRGTLRADLFHRVAGIHLEVPPLRRRRPDVEPLAEHLKEQVAAELGAPSPAFHRSLLRLLAEYEYPGNVRELRSIVAALVARTLASHADAVTLADAARAHIRRNVSVDAAFPAVTFSDTLPTIEEATEQLIDEALRRCGGNQSAAARMLRMTPSAVNKRLHRRSVSDTSRR